MNFFLQSHVCLGAREVTAMITGLCWQSVYSIIVFETISQRRLLTKRGGCHFGIKHESCAKDADIFILSLSKDDLAERTPLEFASE